MPKYEAVVGGKPRQIDLNRTSLDSFTIKIDGKTRQIKLQKDDKLSEKILLMNIDGKEYKVEVSKTEQGSKIPVKVEETSFEVDIKPVYMEDKLMSFAPTVQASTKKTGANKKAAVEGAVTAPMTGKIVKVKVNKGEQVKAGQVLCVIEAMKMENEICSPKAGTVQEVNVADGTPVNEGDSLFIVA